MDQLGDLSTDHIIASATRAICPTPAEQDENQSSYEEQQHSDAQLMKPENA
jgi:hypothetical protein